LSGDEYKEYLRQVGINIYQARFDADMTQAQLADEVGYSSQHISSVETGRLVPSLELINRIARATGVTVATLMDPDGQTPQSPDAA